MSTSLTPPAPWAQNEFGFAQLGDQRRNKRLVNIAEHLAARPGGTLPQAFWDWAELKAAYRFFGQRGVSFERVMAPQSQLERADRLESLIGILAVVAVRLLNAKMLACSRPESCEAVASFGPYLLALLEKKLGQPKDGWTNRNLIRAVARVGGFIGRKSDGEPGWQRLMWMCEGANLIKS